MKLIVRVPQYPDQTSGIWVEKSGTTFVEWRAPQATDDQIVRKVRRAARKHKCRVVDLCTDCPFRAVALEGRLKGFGFTCTISEIEGL